MKTAQRFLLYFVSAFLGSVGCALMLHYNITLIKVLLYVLFDTAIAVGMTFLAKDKKHV